MSPAKRMLCLSVCVLAAGLSWPGTASGNISITQVQWLYEGQPYDYLALPVGTTATIEVTVNLTGNSDWTDTVIQMGDAEPVIFNAPQPDFICPGCTGPFVTQITFDPQDMVGNDGLCNTWPVKVRAVDGDGIIPIVTDWSNAITLNLYDDNSPVISCHDLTVYLNPNGQALVLPSDLITHYEDDCGVMDMATVNGMSSLVFTCADIGDPIAVVVQAFDAVGHWSNLCTAYVTVKDCMPPTIICKEAKFTTDTGLCTATKTVDPPVNKDNCAVVQIEHRFLTIAQHPNFMTDDMDLYYGFDYEEWAVGPVVGFVFPLGTSTIEWRATDGSDNYSTCVQTVIVEDKEKPTIQCGAAITESMVNVPAQYQCQPSPRSADTCTRKVPLVPPTIGDNCPASRPSLTVEIARLGVPAGAPPCVAVEACYPIGETLLVWTATDAAGNTNTCTQSVTITTTKAPFIDACLVEPVCAGTQGYGPNQCTSVGSCEAWVDVCPPTFGDCCPPFIDFEHYGLQYLVVTHTSIGPDGLPGPFNGNFDAPCYMDPCGRNYLDCDQDGNIDPLDRNCEEFPNGPCNQWKSGDFDASGIYPVGTTTITWTVTNPVSGLSATTIQIITVVDCTKPTLCCPPCTCNPTIYTYNAADGISPTDLVNQLRGTLGYFPSDRPCICDDKIINTECQGCISDNCPGVKLVVINAFNPVTHEPIERPNTELFLADHNGYYISFLAKDVAGNYSGGESSVCTMLIYVDRGASSSGPPPSPPASTQVPPKLEKEGDVSTTTVEEDNSTVTPNPAPFSLCGAGAMATLTLMVIGLVSVKLTRRRR